MGKYDSLDTAYFTSKERMAEIIRVGLFRNEGGPLAKELAPIRTKYPSLKSESGANERDGLFLCENHNVKYGLEIENYADYGMAKRIFVYDACEYESEVLELESAHKVNKDFSDFEEIKSKLKKTDRLYPVINTVLYLGPGRYKGRRNMYELFRSCPSSVKPYLADKIQNYGFAVVEADYTNPENYKTELRQFFQAMQARNDFIRLKGLFEREDFINLSSETQKVIAIHLDNKIMTKKVVEEEEDMCKAIRDMLKEAKSEGIIEGKEEGIIEGKMEGKMEGKIEGKIEGKMNLLKELVKDGLLQVSEAAKRADMSEDMFMKLL